MDDSIEVSVAWALPARQTCIPVRIRAGSRLEEAIRASAIMTAHPEIDLSACRIGVWGKLRTPDHVVNQGDRIEIYRPLTADPNTARQHRVNKKRADARGQRKY